MKCNSKYMVFLVFCLCFLFSCSEDEGTKENRLAMEKVMLL